MDRGPVCNVKQPVRRDLVLCRPAADLLCHLRSLERQLVAACQHPVDGVHILTGHRQSIPGKVSQLAQGNKTQPLLPPTASLTA